MDAKTNVSLPVIIGMAIILTFLFKPLPVQAQLSDQEACSRSMEGQLLRADPLVIAPIGKDLDIAPIDESPFHGGEEKFKTIPEGSWFRAYIGEVDFDAGGELGIGKHVCSVEAISPPSVPEPSNYAEESLENQRSSLWDPSGIWLYFDAVKPIYHHDERSSDNGGSLTIFNNGRVVYHAENSVLITDYILSAKQRTDLQSAISILHLTSWLPFLGQGALIIIDHGFHKFPLYVLSESIKQQLGALSRDMLAKSNARLYWMERWPVTEQGHPPIHPKSWSPMFETKPENISQGMKISFADADRFMTTIGFSFVGNRVIAGDYI